MQINGVKVTGIKVVNESNGNEIVAVIKDNHIETTNGYKVEVIPFNIECCE